MLKKPTPIERVRKLLDDGRYVQAAESAKRASDDPLVTLLADALASVGNRKIGGTGRPKDGRWKLVGGPHLNSLTEFSAVLKYEILMEARNIVDGRTDGDIEDAKATLRKWNLHKASRQAFRNQARTAIVKATGLSEEKVSELTRTSHR